MRIFIWISSLAILIQRHIQQVTCGPYSAGIGAIGASKLIINSRFQDPTVYPVDITVDLSYANESPNHLESVTVAGAWIKVNSEMVLPITETASGQLLDHERLGLMRISQSVVQDLCNGAQDGVDTSGVGEFPVKFLRPRGITWVYYLFKSTLDGEAGGFQMNHLRKSNEIYRSVSKNETPVPGIYYETSNKLEDYEHFKTKTPLAQCFEITDNSPPKTSAFNFERRLNNLNKVVFKTSRCEMMSFMTVKLYPPDGIISDPNLYVLMMMGGNRLELSNDFNFLNWDKEMMQAYYGKKFRTSQIKDLIEKRISSYGVGISNNNNLDILERFKFKPFEDHKNINDYTRTMGFSTNLVMRYNIQSQNIDAEELYDFYLILGENTIAKIRSRAITTTTGDKKIQFWHSWANDDPLTGPLDMTTLTKFLEWDVANYVTGGQNMNYCQINANFVPITMRESASDQDVSVGNFQSELTAKLYVFCSGDQDFDGGLPVDPIDHNDRVVEVSLNLPSQPILLKGQIHQEDEFYIKQHQVQISATAKIYIQSLRFFKGITLGKELIPTGVNQIDIEIGGYNAAGSSITSVKPVVHKLDNFHLNTNPLVDNSPSSGCEFNDGRMYYNKKTMICEVIKESLVLPGCNIYLNSGTCAQCGLSVYYFDPFRRGPCRRKEEGCPDGNGVFSLPVTWDTANLIYCLTCPLNSAKCFERGKWVNSCLLDDDGLMPTTDADNYDQCNCSDINNGCEVCEMTFCDKCQDGLFRIFDDVLGTFKCDLACPPDSTWFRNTTSVDEIHRPFCEDTSAHMDYGPPIGLFGVPRGIVGYRLRLNDDASIFSPIQYDACDPSTTYYDSSGFSSSFCHPTTGLAQPSPVGEVCQNQLRVPFQFWESNYDPIVACDDVGTDYKCNFYNITNSCQVCGASMKIVRHDSMNYDCDMPPYMVQLPNTAPAVGLDGDSDIWIACPIPFCQSCYMEIGDGLASNHRLVCRQCARGYTLSRNGHYCDCDRASLLVQCPANQCHSSCEICGLTGCLKCLDNTERVNYIDRFRCSANCDFNDNNNFAVKTFSFDDTHPQIPTGTTSFNQDYCYPKQDGSAKLYMCDDMDLINPFRCNSCDSGAHLHPENLWCSALTCPTGSKYVTGNCMRCSVRDCMNCNSNINKCESKSCTPGYYGVSISNGPPPWDRCEKLGQDVDLPFNGPPISVEPLSISEAMATCEVSNCADCKIDSTRCERCTFGRNLSVNRDSCLTACPLGTKFEVISGGINRCVACKVQDCAECVVSENICDKCMTGKYLTSDNKACISSCNGSGIVALLLSSSDMRCVNCEVPFCESCPVINRCRKCLPPLRYSIDQNECVATCNSPEFEVASIPDGFDYCELRCGDYCDVCDNPVTCQICDRKPSPNDAEWYRLALDQKCYEFCPLKTLTVQGQGRQPLEPGFEAYKCKTCEIGNCKDCRADYQQCFECVDDLFLEFGECVPICSNGNVPDTTGIWKCVSCADDCNICADANSCQECNTGYFLDAGQCTTDCGDYKYPNQLSQCVDCENDITPNRGWCKDCTNVIEAGKYCRVCEDQGDVSSQKYLASNLQGCLDVCPAGQVPNNLNVCVTCPPNCIHCDSANTSICNVCAMPYALSFNGDCVMGCSNGQYQETLTPSAYSDSTGTPLDSNICRPCNGNGCFTCLENGGAWDICGSCIKDFSITMAGNSCVLTCPLGQYSKDVGNDWFECDLCTDSLNCKSCDVNNPGYCLECNVGFYRKGGLCVSDCGDTFYANGQLQCIPCPQTGCKVCSQSSCTRCMDPLFYVQSQSNQNCDEGCPYNTQTYLNSPYACQNCPIDDCFKCSEDRTHCLECTVTDANEDPHPQPLLLTYPHDQATCVDSCGEGFFNDPTHCFPCAETNCKTCDDTECFDCFYPWVFNTVTKTCISQCPDGMYLNGADQKCYNCQVGCQLCSNGVTCNLCDAPRKVDSHTRQCVDCLTDQSRVIVEHECFNCEATCLECDGVEQQDCTKCYPGNNLTVTSKCIPPNPNPINVEDLRWDEVKSKVHITFNQKFVCPDIRNAFKRNLVNNDGAVIETSLKRHEISGTQDLFWYEIVISSKVVDGVLTLQNVNKGVQPQQFKVTKVVRGLSGQENYFLEDIVFENINYDPDMSARLNNIGLFAGTGLKSATFVTMIVSISASIALIKIFQMMDFMLFFTVVHPKNFQKFLEIFSSNFLNDFPNIFAMLFDDNCGEMRVKFYEEEMSCQFLSNCGQLIFILCLALIIKMIIWLLKNVTSDSNKLKSKAALWVAKFNNFFNIEFFISLMDMFQLDFYLAIFLQLDDFEIRSNLSLINIAFAMIIMLAMIFAKIYLFFISTRIANIRMAKSKSEKGYKKHYYNFLFLNQDTDCATWYSKHQLILNLIKDPFLALFLVYASKSPFVQIGASLLIMLTYLILEIVNMPQLKPKENWRNLISLFVYTVTILLFLILAMVEDKLTENSRESFIGIPLIILVSFLILSNYYISMAETVKGIKRRCKAKSKKPQDGVKQQDETVDDVDKIAPLPNQMMSKKRILSTLRKKGGNKIHPQGKGNKIIQRLAKIQSIPSQQNAKGEPNQVNLDDSVVDKLNITHRADLELKQQTLGRGNVANKLGATLQARRKRANNSLRKVLQVGFLRQSLVQLTIQLRDLVRLNIRWLNNRLIKEKYIFWGLGFGVWGLGFGTNLMTCDMSDMSKNDL